MKRALVLLLACVPALVFGATYKCVDKEGRVSYSQAPEPGKRCTTPNLPEVQVIPAPSGAAQREGKAARQAEENDKPEADAGKGLSEARKALDQARQNLAEQEAQRLGGEKNYQRYLDRLKPYQDAVKQAEERLRQVEQGAK